MNIQQEEAAIQKLSPRQYTIRILVAAVCSLFTLSVGFVVYLKNENARLSNGWNQCTEDKQRLVEDWKDQDKQEGAERIRKSEEDRRKADSILTIVLMTKSNIKKAIQNERRKK